MSSVNITLPDGSIQSVPAGSRPIDVAKSIGTRLADAAVVARVNGDLVDLTRPIEKDARLEILTAKDPAALEVYRHSTAHLLAAAVLELYPETKLGIGPPTDTGFFYDFQRDTPFTPEDLEKLEKKMAEIQARNLPYERVMTPKEEGLRKYADQKMKIELITEKADDIFSEYTLGPNFIDFCRGPHLPSRPRSRRSSCSPSPAPTGRATRKTSACSASTAPPSFQKRSSTNTSSAWRKPRSAITASSARSSTCSASRSWPAPA